MWGINRSPVNSPHKGQWRGSLKIFFICALNKWFSKQLWGWWFEALSCSLWRHCNDVQECLALGLPRIKPQENELFRQILITNLEVLLKLFSVSIPDKFILLYYLDLTIYIWWWPDLWKFSFDWEVDKKTKYIFEGFDCQKCMIDLHLNCQNITALI